MANICISAQHGISSKQAGQFSQNSLKCGEKFCEPFAKRNETPRPFEDSMVAKVKIRLDLFSKVLIDF